MKLLLFFGIILLFTWFSFSAKKSSIPLHAKTKQTIHDTIDYVKEVLPILVKNCSPCHFPGGKLYQKLPFDQDTTIVHHETVVLKRIKNEEENLIIKNFIQQNKNGLKQAIN
jgi:hypothetical protein